MVNKLILKAASSRRLEALVRNPRMTGRLVNRFVAGSTLTEALDAAAREQEHGVGAILDLLGEGVVDRAGAAAATEEYKTAVRELSTRELTTATVSVKLSQLGLLIDAGACLANLKDILELAADVGVGVEVDMEGSDCVSDTLAVFREAAGAHPGTRLALQAYLLRTPADLEAMAGMAPKVRLVKGAYAEPADQALQGKTEITDRYHLLTDWLFEHGTDPAFGTHDDACIDYAKNSATRHGIAPNGYEFQMLYGIRRDLQRSLAQDGYRVRVYIPFGSSWYPYLMRRMAEKPANLFLFLRSLVGT
jgi:proline dehydrogenase